VKVPSVDLPDDELIRALESLHRTRTETLRHGADQALAAHTARMNALEAEYVRRHPAREVDPDRTRAGARDE
jgi:hypothetical protein